jgi:hypothetical protein
MEKLYMQDDNASIKLVNILVRKIIRARLSSNLFRPKGIFSPVT